MTLISSKDQSDYFFQSFIRGQVILTRHDRHIVLGQSPLVGVFLVVVEIDEIPRHPQVAPTVGVFAVVEFLLPLGIGLSAYLHAPDGDVGLRREVHISGPRPWNPVFQSRPCDGQHELLHVVESGFFPDNHKSEKPMAGMPSMAASMAADIVPEYNTLMELLLP